MLQPRQADLGGGGPASSVPANVRVSSRGGDLPAEGGDADRRQREAVEARVQEGAVGWRNQGEDHPGLPAEVARERAGQTAPAGARGESQQEPAERARTRARAGADAQGQPLRPRRAQAGRQAGGH